MIDRVDNETKKARLFLSQSNSKESEGNNTSGTFESAHGKYVHVVDANKQLKRIPILNFSGSKKNISRGGPRFPVVWMKQISQLSLKCCGSKVV